MPTLHRPLILAILDGWGLDRPGPGNAIRLAHTPHMNQWNKEYPHTHLTAYGPAVGVSQGATGNSEVGHINIGAGYVVLQDEVRINTSIEDGSFFANPQLIEACQKAKRNGGALHIIGLVGAGQIHSRIEHLWAMLEMARQQQVTQTYVHAFSDGRDASPTWMGKNAAAVETKIASLGGQIASLCGRYFAMDRDGRWDRIEKAYRMLVDRKGLHAATLEAAVEHSYDQGHTDEFIEPTIIGNGRAIQDGDSVVFINFRTDRPRLLTQAFVEPNFKGFARPIFLGKLNFYTMTEYQAGLPVSGVAFPPVNIAHPLAEVLSQARLRQLHASETEKYAHVTYFINGGREEPFPGEDRIQVPSPKVATYDLQPQMSAIPLTDRLVTAIEAKKYDVIIVNYANADMVGHTGHLDAAITAVETVDACLGRLEKALRPLDGILVITADHGNAEAMISPDGEPNTQHHSADVPLLVIGSSLPGKLQRGVLANVSPTILELLHIEPPQDMTAASLWTDKS